MGILCVTPTAMSVRSLLSDLLGRAVEVQMLTRKELTSKAAAAVAVYVSETGALAGVAAVDLAVGGALGAGLALLPPRLVAEGEAAGELQDDVMENLAEVFNVMTPILNAEGRPRVTLDMVYRSSDQLPAPVSKMLDGQVGQVPLNVSVSGYGAGNLAIVVR
ncbi:MAG TPA: hypothetical protein VFJ85_00370 [Acidimicrobiales bacterium]|nr:hypothetical protein [Acidimicrobiales bacterium]